MQLKPGQPAPRFATRDVFGEPVTLDAYAGTRLMLMFYRFASCPFCNLRIHRLLAHRDELGGLALLAVFQSDPALVRKYTSRHEAPFPIVADPERQLYEPYGVGASRLGLVRAALRVGDVAIAMSKGFIPGDVDTPADLLPADFLIDESGVIRVAYYGRDPGDHLPVSRVLAFARAGTAARGRHAPDDPVRPSG